jgi:hypothetical protein
MYNLYSKKTRKGYAMRQHCINKKRSRMEVYNGNKQESRICVGATRTKRPANGCSFRTIARWTDYGHYGHYGNYGNYGHYGNYGPQYEIHFFQQNMNIKFTHVPVQYECSMFNVPCSIQHLESNSTERSPSSGRDSRAAGQQIPR